MKVLFPSISDTDGEWADVLNQNFLVPTGTIPDAEVQSDSTATCTGSGAFRGCDVPVTLIDGSTFLGNFYTLSDPGGNTLPWSSYYLQDYEGQDLTLELISDGFFDTRGSSSCATGLNAAFDDVELNVTTASAAPEPASAVLPGARLLLTGSLWRRSALPKKDWR